MKNLYLIVVVFLTTTANAQYTAIPDANFEAALAAYDDISNDGQVPTNSINTLTFLNVSNNNITSLNGIQDFTALEQLEFNDNDIQTVDLSQNVSLQRLRSYSNPLINLDLSHNTQLIELRGYACPMLTSVNIANGNNSNMSHFNISSNTNLVYVEVDNQTIADDWNNDINLPSTYSTSTNVVYGVLGVNEAYVPDDAFEAYLEANSLGNGINNDNRADKSLISVITTLNIGNLGIIDAIGIESFTAIETLQINDNNLETIYLNTLSNLTTFRVTRNNLTVLNLNNQPNLEIAILDSNNLYTLSINSTSLRVFQIAGNNFTSIDVSVFPLLERLFCGGNDLTSLNVDSNPELKTIECQNNDLISIDVSGNPDIEDLLVFNNQLTSLNVKNGNNAFITSFRAENNSSLDCIEVDDEIAASNGTGSYSTWQKDTSTVYSEDCSAVLNAPNFNLNVISMYPNPVKDIMNIDIGNSKINRLDILDINGRLMITQEDNFEIVNMSQLNAGIYFVTFYASKKSDTVKIIKQ
ncbi:T9SS type A sorting domain-containing protein [uncultured Winogradskyella sp.]|uniref:T9SS type A sorting domain-containing protein n=1 Tax=uncultured Winogradskyella sp. TaxID=395353 RepID=UPI00261C48E8|nr:T9SS type A sorting domain-containing protein [uncultured Winogradskyella sp.]